MRTTLDIADDVLFAAKELGKKNKQSVGVVITELARQALQSGPIVQHQRPEEFMGFRPLPARGVIITSELINQLREEEGI